MNARDSTPDAGPRTGAGSGWREVECHFRKLCLSAVAAFVLCAFLLASMSAHAQYDTRSSAVGGVTVKVTPKVLAPEASLWEFALVLDTHSQALDDDLARVAALVADDGRRYAPIAWIGAPPGGHHREGVLRFEAIKPAPRAIELTMQRPGEVASRIFRWELR